KENGGQASAFNAGFAASRGDVVVFLDADDLLLPSAVERVVPYFRDSAVVRVHGPVWETDGRGARTGARIPRKRLPQGNLRDGVLRGGPHAHPTAQLAGNAWSRGFLEMIFPVPAELRRSADVYPVTLAA